MYNKRVFLAYYVLYAVMRFIATTVEAFSHVNLQLSVLIISEAISLVGILVGIWWARGKPIPAGLVRGLLGINAAASLANILITRANPLEPGASTLDLIVIGTLFDAVLFLAALMVPMPEVARGSGEVPEKK